jgi:hypothetical protein
MPAGDTAITFADEYEFSPFKPLGDASGMTMDVINTLTCVLLAYPLGIIFSLIPTSMVTLRHVFAGSVGMAMCFLCFRWEAMHLVIQTFVTYLIIVFGGKRQQDIALWYCIAHLSLSNLYHRIYHFNDYSLNVNGPLMVMTQKLSQLAFSVYDGQMSRTEKEKALMGKKTELDRGGKAALAMFEELGVKNVPSLLEVFGYSFNFWGVLLGPNHQYVDYKQLIEGTGGSAEAAFTGIVPGLKKLLFAVSWMVWS